MIADFGFAITRRTIRQRGSKAKRNRERIYGKSMSYSKVFAGDAEVERACLPGWVDLKRDDGSFLDPDGAEGGAEKVFDEG